MAGEQVSLPALIFAHVVGCVCSLVLTVAGFVLDLLSLTPERTGGGFYLRI